jgi:hypothetical protein
MKRMTALLLVVLVVLSLTACSSKTKDIDGVLTGYVQVEEYSAPLAVIENHGKTYYLATSILEAATNVDQIDDSLLEAIKNEEIVDIEVSIGAAEKGKTIEIDGKRATVWQSHQIYKKE